MAARKRKGAAAQQKTVVALEALKALLRLGLMRATSGRTGVQPPVAERQVDPALLELNREKVARMRRAPAAAQGEGVTAVPPPRSAADVLLRREEGAHETAVGQAEAETVEKEFWTGARTGYVRPTLASLRQGAGDSAAVGGGFGAPKKGKDVGKEYLLSRVLTIEDVKRPQDLVAKAHGVKRLAEVIWILRPLIYGAFESRFSTSSLSHELTQPLPLQSSPCASTASATHSPSSSRSRSSTSPSRCASRPTPSLARTRRAARCCPVARRASSRRTRRPSAGGPSGGTSCEDPCGRAGPSALAFLSLLAIIGLRLLMPSSLPLQAAAREHRAQVRGQAARRVRLDAPQRLHPLVRRVLLLYVAARSLSRRRVHRRPG